MYASTRECGAAQQDAAAPGDGRGAHEVAARRIRACEATIRTALAEQSRWIAEIAAQGSYADDGARSMRSWLGELLNLAGSAAATRVRVAEATRLSAAVSGAPLDAA